MKRKNIGRLLQLANAVDGTVLRGDNVYLCVGRIPLPSGLNVLWVTQWYPNNLYQMAKDYPLTERVYS